MSSQDFEIDEIQHIELRLPVAEKFMLFAATGLGLSGDALVAILIAPLI